MKKQFYLSKGSGNSAWTAFHVNKPDLIIVQKTGAFMWAEASQSIQVSGLFSIFPNLKIDPGTCNFIEINSKDDGSTIIIILEKKIKPNVVMS